jgi:hypothetical protein
MPIHDWTRVDAGIFHAFHHSWIEELARALNRGILPPDYYALQEQHAAGFGPDVLALQEEQPDDSEPPTAAPPETAGSGGGVLGAPKLQPIAETDLSFYRRKQKGIAVRHVGGDQIVAMIEIVSPGNKASRNAMRAFKRKAAELLDHQISLMLLDLLPPGRRDPQGIHGEVWEEVAGQEYVAPAGKPLTLASYDSGPTLRAYVVHRAVGDPLTDMPLFLEPERAVTTPLEATYQAAFVEVPRRWRRVLEAPRT